MARCVHCGKDFDYEKYYGICPKCGSYNQEKLPEEKHVELHRTYDTMAQGQAAAPAKASAAGTVVFVLLILGIVGTIVTPFIYFIGRTVRLGLEAVALESEAYYQSDSNLWEDYWENEITPDYEEEHVLQNPPILSGTVEMPCLLGEGGQVAVTVHGVRVMAPAGRIAGFPEGEKLIAISVSSQMDEEYAYHYGVIDTVYVGYGEGIYKENMYEYELADYAEELGGLTCLDGYGLCEETEGDILAFVPEDVTECFLYLESREEDTSQLLAIYEIPLTIPAGEDW